jgi:hypothetical protein
MLYELLPGKFQWRKELGIDKVRVEVDLKVLEGEI